MSDQNDKPFIHLMKTPYGYYFYDVNTDSIIKTVKEVYDALSKEQGSYDYNNRIDKETEKKIDILKNDGFLLSTRPKKIEHPECKHIEYTLSNNVRKIILQITQKCNFRCSYCIYSEDYSENQRRHSLKSMTPETAKKAIDFLIKNSKNTKEAIIGFYGGEPLLEFELIKYCVDYGNKVFEGKSLSYSITTNGSLLTDEIVEFFIKNKFNILISLDGPKEIHDKSRRFASNGCGTFNIIEKNILKIKEKYPEYFRTISFNMVIDPSNDLKCLNNFFSDYSYFKEASSFNSNIINDTYSNEKVYISKDYIDYSIYEEFKAFLYHFKRINSISPIAMQSLIEISRLIKDLNSTKRLNDTTSHSGPCIPGTISLLVNVDGYFYPCEQVSEESEVMKIGHLDTGFDINRAKELLNVCKLTENMCKQCWAIQHCYLCARHADNITELSAELKSSYCSNVKYRADRLFKNHIALCEIKTLYKYLIS